MHRFYFLLLASSALLAGCFKAEIYRTSGVTDDSLSVFRDSVIINTEAGCSGYRYPPLNSTLYVLPYPAGQTVPTGLTNCSSSFHSAGRGDALAYDFDMPPESRFTAIRAGWVAKVVEDQGSYGGDGAGNYVVVNHGDRTYALYYHSPYNGILVEKGQYVKQGQELGVVGRSGYAGYTHLHLIVVAKNFVWPYTGVPITFRNVLPRHLILESNFTDGYKALPY